LSKEIIYRRLRLVFFHRLFGATAIPDVQERQNTRQSLLYSDSIHDLATLYHSILLNTRRDGRGPRTPQVSEGRCRGGNSEKTTAPNRCTSPVAFAILRVLILCVQRLSPTTKNCHPSTNAPSVLQLLALAHNNLSPLVNSNVNAQTCLPTRQNHLSHLRQRVRLSEPSVIPLSHRSSDANSFLFSWCWIKRTLSDPLRYLFGASTK
jgi:hypothetical protein